MHKSSIRRLTTALCLLLTVCMAMMADDVAFTIRKITGEVSQFFFSQSPEMTISGDSIVITTNDSDQPFRFAFNEVLSYVPGDADDNGKADDDDVWAMIQSIIHLTPSRYDAQAADINIDETVDVADVGILIDQICGNESSGYTPISADSLYFTDHKASIGTSVSMPLYLSNRDSITAFQFDLTYPERMTLTTDESGSIKVNLNDRNNGTLRIAFQNSTPGLIHGVIYSTDNSVIPDTAGAIVTFTFDIPKDMTWGDHGITLSNIIFNTKGNHKVLQSPKTATLTIANYTTQTIELAQGWNWVSFPVDDTTILTQLKSLTNKGIRAIVSRNQMLSYDATTDSWYGNLTSIDGQTGYKVFLEKPATVILSGSTYQLKSSPIHIQKGWNWIPYLSLINQYASDALMAYPATNGDKMRNQTGESIMYSGSWIGSFAMEKSKSYHYYSNASGDRNLIYSQTSADDSSSSSAEGGKYSEFVNIDGSQNSFDVKAHDMPSYTLDNSEYDSEDIMYITLSKDGNPVIDLTGCTLSAWVGNECRGLSGAPLRVGSRDIFAIRVWGSETTGGIVTLRMTDTVNDKEYTLKQLYTTNYIANAIGSLTNPTEYYIYENPLSDLVIDLDQTTRTLGQEIYARVGDYTKVTSLKLLGKADYSDIQCLSNLTSLIHLDMGHMTGATNTDIYNLDSLQTLILPESLSDIFWGLHIPHSCLTDVTMMAFYPPMSYESNVHVNATLHTTEYSRAQYVKAGWDKYFNQILGDVPEPADRDIYVYDNHTLTYTNSMYANNFTPNIFLANGKSNGVLSLYGSQPVTLGSVSMCYNNNASDYGTNVFLPHVECSVTDANLELVNNKDAQMFFSPSFNVKVSDIKPLQTGSWVIKRYDSDRRAAGSDSTWQTVPADAELQAGEAYFLIGNTTDNVSYCKYQLPATSATANLIGTIADRQVSVADHKNGNTTSADWNWNFIGNPYPAFYDISRMSYQAPIIVWNLSSKAYEVYSPIDDIYALAPGQAFFVQTNGQTQITFPADGRQTTRNRDLGLVKSNGNNTDSRRVCNITLTGTDGSDRARIVLNPQSRTDYEIGSDMIKMFSYNALMHVYLISDAIRYAIDECPALNADLFIGIQLAELGQYTLSADGDGLLVEDTQTRETFTLSKDKTYNFTSLAGIYDHRFRVIASGATDIEPVNCLDQGQQTVYDLSGRKTTKTDKGVYIINGKKQFVK